MAGSRQHHIWQLLQRGFGTKRGRDHHVWVYEKCQKPDQTATRLFGVEKHFYGPESSQADTNITKYEGDNQSTIQQIRKQPDGAPVDADFVATLITHLEIRSNFLRSELSTAMQDAVGGLANRFSSADEVRQMMKVYLNEHPEELEKLLGKAFIPVSQRRLFGHMMHKFIETLDDDTVTKSMQGSLGEMLKMSGLLPDIIKTAQNKALADDAPNQPRSSQHRERNYFVFRPNQGSFILPDTTLAFVTKDGASPFSNKDDGVEGVIVPISSEVVIIGKTTGSSGYPPKAINRILAGCSFKSFIAKDKSEQFQGLTGRIGKFAKLIDGQELQNQVYR